MSAPFRLIDVKPTGTHTGPAFVEYKDRRKSGLELVTSSSYPPSAMGEALRTLRVHEDPFMNLVETKKITGIGLADFSGLERGSKTLESEAEWDRLFHVIRDAKKASS